MVYNGSLLQVFSQLFHHLARTTYYTLSTDVSSFHDIGSLVTETVICIPGQYAIRGTRGQGFVAPPSSTTWATRGDDSTTPPAYVLALLFFTCSLVGCLAIFQARIGPINKNTNDVEDAFTTCTCTPQPTAIQQSIDPCDTHTSLVRTTEQLQVDYAPTAPKDYENPNYLKPYVLYIVYARLVLYAFLANSQHIPASDLATAGKVFLPVQDLHLGRAGRDV
ncbi:hypothetical protein EX30DRAFT_188018 [Ascodesmis nigricans]|uniref:Uncharacterized protein n=1 Tax=Ascodesmis nigricans TaxID=341454 RepID=A0A4S2N0H4_9PEZI|nr:hypothetical protein EX30DRAFT_188018 [Ascodesmis nigricans]